MSIFAPRLRRLAIVVTAGVLAALAAAALAAPARQGTVSASAPTYNWDGGPGNGNGLGTAALRCTPSVYECEDTLVEVKDPGDLYAFIKAGEGANDLDVAIYKSDASGTTASDPVNGDQPDAEDISTGKDSRTTLKRVNPGFYVVRVRVFDGADAVWKGTATLLLPGAGPTGATGPSGPTGPTGPAGTPPSKPAAKERRNACKKKAKRIKNKKKRKKALKKCRRIK
jgi:hypothetical protein